MIQSIPLKKLVPSPRNVRKSSDVLADLHEDELEVAAA